MTSTPRPGPSRSMQFALLGTLALVLAPHVTHLPAWLTGVTAAILLWRYQSVRRQWPLPNKWLLFALAATGVLGVVLQFHTLFGREAGVAMLTLMTALKLLETKGERDVWLVVFLGYFLVLTHFLYSQSLFIAAYLLLVAWLFTTVLIAFSQPQRQLPWRAQLALSAKMLLQSLPVMLVLFFLFPRISGPLWRLPSDAATAQTGLSDHMSPGMFSKLVQSDSVAFRVEFEGRPLPAALRYFRVKVLDRFDGYTWSAGRAHRWLDVPAGQGPSLRYTVTLEPSNKPWLPVLDFADTRGLPPDAELNTDFSVTAREAVQNRKRYRATAHTRLGDEAEVRGESPGLALALPPASNPRAQRYAAELMRASRDAPDYIRRVLKRFHDDAFVYTLQPPRLGTDSVDEFLFDTKRGFCEHYAGSFTFLMRAAGIPARVVTGYQNGDYNTLGNYLIVRQADAHAWSEVWLPQRGWVRVDPTAAVAPDRIEQGIANALPAGEPLPGFLRAPNPWLRQLRLSWDAFNNQWNQWVLGFDQERQVALFVRMGFGVLSWQDLVWYLMLGLSAVSGFLAVLTLRGRRAKSDPVERAYAQFCERLRRIDIARAPTEGPLDFARRARALRPDLAPAVEAITDAYVALRYGTRATAADVHALRRLVRGFRARRQARLRQTPQPA